MMSFFVLLIVIIRYAGNSVPLGLSWKATRAVLTAINLEYFDAATALKLLNLVYFCNVLSTGQLPLQVVHLVRIAAIENSHCWGNVRLANVIGRYYLGDKEC